MTFTDVDPAVSLFHVGVVVPDLRAAVGDYSAALHLEFAEVHRVLTDVTVDGTRRQAELLLTYSKAGPAHLELIEEVAGETWAADSLGLNHLGFWATDLKQAAHRLEASGFRERVRDATVPPRMTYHQSSQGVWVELVDVGLVRSGLLEWLATGYDATMLPSRDR